MKNRNDLRKQNQEHLYRAWSKENQGRMTEALNMQKRQAKHPSNLIAQNISGELEKKACSVRVNYSNKMLKLLLLLESKMSFKETHFSHLSHMMKKYSCLVRRFCVIMYFCKSNEKIQVKKTQTC